MNKNNFIKLMILLSLIDVLLIFVSVLINDKVIKDIIEIIYHLLSLFIFSIIFL